VAIGLNLIPFAGITFLWFVGIAGAVRIPAKGQGLGGDPALPAKRGGLSEVEVDVVVAGVPLTSPVITCQG
jgi:hypothetical protein